MRSAKSGHNLWQIWQVFGPWTSPYGANAQMTMTVHNYRPRQFHRTSNGENPSSGYKVPQVWQPPARPPDCDDNTPPARKYNVIKVSNPTWLRTQKSCGRTSPFVVRQDSKWPRSCVRDRKTPSAQAWLCTPHCSVDGVRSTWLNFRLTKLAWVHEGYYCL